MKKVYPKFQETNNEYMIFGIDVIHPSPTEKTDNSKAESIAAVCYVYYNIFNKSYYPKLFT